MKKTWMAWMILSMMFFLPAAQAEVSTGERAPDFNLRDTSGRAHNLTDHRGEYVILEWINHDCPFVKKHYGSGNMQALQQEMVAQGAVWYSVASSAPGKQGHYSGDEWNRLTQEKNAAPTAVLLDADGQTGRAYGAKTTPHMYIINPEGTLVYQGAIDSISSASPADIPNAVNYVRQAMGELGSGKDVSESSTKAYGCSVKY